MIFHSSLILILTLMGYCGQCFNASNCKYSLQFQHDVWCMEFVVSIWRISLSKLIQLDWILLSSLLSCLNFFLVFSMMRNRVDARRLPTLRDVHPHTKWSLFLRVYHKFHIERIGFGRKRLNLVVLDTEVKLGTSFFPIMINHFVYSLEF